MLLAYAMNGEALPVRHGHPLLGRTQPDADGSDRLGDDGKNSIPHVPRPIV